MKIQGGSKYLTELVAVDGDRVTFIAEDGREMFEVRAGADGRSIEIRGIETCKVKGKLYGSALEIRPNVSNDIVVRARLYSDS